MARNPNAPSSDKKKRNNGNELDFIGPSEAVKELFALPYTMEQGVSVAVHNVGGTLLLEPGDVDVTSSSYFSSSGQTMKNSGTNTSKVNNTKSHTESAKNEDTKKVTGQLPHLKSSNAHIPEHRHLGGGGASAALSLVTAMLRQISDSDNFDPTSQKRTLEQIKELSGQNATKSRESVNQISAISPVSESKIITRTPSKPKILFDDTSSSENKYSPEYYASDVVRPPVEPRQYLNWKYHDMNLLIASDAIIYRPQNAPVPPSTETPTFNNFNGSNGNRQQSNMSQALAIRLADTHDFRQQIHKYEETIKNRSNFQAQKKASHASYAEVLQSSKTNVERVISGNEEQEDTQSQDNLRQMQLHTCIIPGDHQPVVSAFLRESQYDVFDKSNHEPDNSISPVCTCLDAYLDNIMANVPQLALCLQEKGFIQSVKLLRTDDIPTHMMRGDILTSNSTTSAPSTKNAKSNPSNPSAAFSPSVVDLNATMLLQFLKDNCSTENNTYLLRRNAGEQNIQLYDVTSISSKRQRKWTWWLAMTSYRFALRLGQCSKSTVESSLRRSFRARQRSLLQTSLDLFSELSDMDNGGHETIRASVNELIADTFLGNDFLHPDEFTSSQKASGSQPSPSSTSSQPYGNVSVDGLNKAQDYVVNAIRTLEPLLETAKTRKDTFKMQLERKKKERDRRRHKQQNKRANDRHKRTQQHRGKTSPTLVESDDSTDSDTLSDNDDSDEAPSTSLTDLMEQMKRSNITNTTSVPQKDFYNDDELDSDSLVGIEEDLESTSFQVEAISLQLFGLHLKLVNVSLRLAEHHLKNYWSSSAMQALRTSARKLASAVSLLSPLNLLVNDEDYECKPSSYLQEILNQYAWLFEYCGHFARSFAADDLWRERGHTCGDDIVSLLRDVESACECLGREEESLHNFTGSVYITEKTKGQVTLHSLSGLINEEKEQQSESKRSLSHDKAESRGEFFSIIPPSSMEAADSLLDRQSQLKRDKRRVLIASVVCYSRAIGTFTALIENRNSRDNRPQPNIPNSSSKSPSLPYDKSSSMKLPLNSTALSNSDSLTAISTGKMKVTTSQAYENEHDHNAIILSLLRKRLGDCCNEIGKVLLSTVKELLGTPMSNKSAAAPLIASAQFWFLEGLDHFEQCKDPRNIALLRCNLCQCCKIRANAHVTTSSKNSSGNNNKVMDAEAYLQAAADHLQNAHSALRQRDGDPKTWDMVSEELAATFLVLGVRRRQSLLGGGTTPVIVQSLRLTPGEEQSVVKPMEQALEIYENLCNAHQAAAAHYQLALFYAKIWTCQRNEIKTREKLSAAFMHYSHAHRYFFSAMKSNEATFVILSLDLSNLYSSVSGAECLKKALACCLDTSDAFKTNGGDSSRESFQQKQEWSQKMNTLATSIEERVFKLLLNLVKIEKKENECSLRGNVSTKEKYKFMYREALGMKMEAKKRNSSDNYNQFEHNFEVHGLLTRLKELNLKS